MAKSSFDPSKWISNLDKYYNSITKSLRVDLRSYSKGESEHGKSKAYASCGFCNSEHEVFIWSFIGGGKKCDNCGALMCIGHCYIELRKLNRKQMLKLGAVEFPDKIKFLETLQYIDLLRWLDTLLAHKFNK